MLDPQTAGRYCGTDTASLLRDLQALAERQDDPAAFRKRFGELRAQHQRKPSLLDRFDQAGLPR